MTSQAFTRILVGVDDSPAAMAAARLAIRVAASSGGCIRFVNVLSDGELTQALTLMQHDGGLQERRSAAAAGLLRHVAGEADRAGVPADTVSLNGQPAAILLAQARDWAADLVVLGRADVRGPGHPFVGTVTRHVLEFSERPVLVVPRPL
ncbi:MAG TPA: universal stress protein [Nocardioidaceae bacterium]|nr:universal stress protein [Nocardioidaceae bacterium]